MIAIDLIRRFGFIVLAFAWLGSACGDSSDDTEPRCGGDGDADGSITEHDGDGDAAIAPSPCTGSTKAELCTEFCETMCQSQELYCLASECETDDCTADGEIFQICDAKCEDDGCARELCEDVQDLSCEAFGLELNGMFESYCLGRDPSCDVAAQLGCSNVCGSEHAVGGDLADNGQCDDGRDESDSAVCTRGTDCTDCGPHVCVEPGGVCTTHGDCCGFGAEPGALCLDADGAATGEPPSCVSACDAEHPCPNGFQCNATSTGQDVCI